MSATRIHASECHLRHKRSMIVFSMHGATQAYTSAVLGQGLSPPWSLVRLDYLGSTPHSKLILETRIAPMRGLRNL